MSRERSSPEAAVCFSIGFVLAFAGSMWLRSGSTAAAVEIPADSPAPVAAPAPAPVVVEEIEAPTAAEPLPASHYANVAVPGAEPGAELGRFHFTRDYVVDESHFTAPSAYSSVTIYDDRECKEIATLSRGFVRELDMEGTGRLRDGRTINVSTEHCACGRSPCYRTMTSDAQWGVGARGEPLEPFRTVAVDPDVIKLGTRLYIPELDGLTMPGPAPWGGFVHDGCVVAIDVGGRIRGRDLDFFVGRHVHMKAFDARAKLEHVTVYRGDQRCDRRL